MAEIAYIKNVIMQEVQFLRGDDSDRLRQPMPVKSWSAQEIRSFPEGMEAFQFQTRVQTEVLFTDGRSQKFAQVVNFSSPHLIRKERGEDEANVERVPVHPDLEGKIWVVKIKPRTSKFAA
jgi:hypothetical protein